MIFADAGPLSWKRVTQHPTLRQQLGMEVNRKWKEATTGPAGVLKEELESGDETFRERLRLAQSMPSAEAYSTVSRSLAEVFAWLGCSVS